MPNGKKQKDDIIKRGSETLKDAVFLLYEYPKKITKK